MENLFLLNEGNYRSCYKKAGIHTLKLKQLSLKCDNLLWGYDYLTLLSYSTDLLLTCPCFSKVRNSSNNAQFYIPGSELDKCPFDIVNITLTTKGKVSTYMVSVSYDDHPVNLCRFVFLGSPKSEDNKNLMAQIDIYGKAWRLQSAMNGTFLLDAFIRSLILWGVEEEDEQDIIDAFFTYYVSRVDFRIDFWSKDKSFYDNIIHPYDLLKRTMSGKNEYYKDDGKTYSSKNVGKRENKYIYVRFYDKKQEINDDNTQFLYSDYYNYEGNIWRLEFQFMSRFTTSRKKYNFWDLFLTLDGGGLCSQIFEYLGLSLKSGAFSRFYSPDSIPFDKLPLWKKKSINSRLKNIINYISSSGVNPIAYIDFLYQNDDDKTKIDKFHMSINDYIDNKDKLIDDLNDGVEILS